MTTIGSDGKLPNSDFKTLTTNQAPMALPFMHDRTPVRKLTVFVPAGVGYNVQIWMDGFLVTIINPGAQWVLEAAKGTTFDLSNIFYQSSDPWTGTALAYFQA